MEKHRRISRYPDSPVRGEVDRGADQAGFPAIKDVALQIISLNVISAEGRLNETINEMGGIGTILTHDKANRMVISLDMQVQNYEPLEYEMSLIQKGNAYAVESEILAQKRISNKPRFKHIDSNYDDIKYFDIDENKLVRPTWEHVPFESSLSQVPKMFKQPEDMRRTLSSSSLYHVLNVEPKAPVRVPQSMKPARLPGRDGSDLVSLLYYLRETDRELYDLVEDTLRAAFPGFEYLNFPPVAAGMLAMTWKEKHFKKPLFMNQLSEGALRFLWLTALLQSPGLTAVTMVDEPEVSLHPELLSLFAELLREASQRSQISIATHSDRLIRFLNPEEVVVMDIGEDGVSSAVWADTFDLEEWLEEYTLDEVWRMGRMGGRS